MDNNPKSRNFDIVIQNVNDEVLIYDLNSNKAVCLNNTAALVFSLCDGKNTIRDIQSSMSRSLGIEVSQEIIFLAIDGLKKEDLLENTGEISFNFAGISRREVIRKIGFGSLVTLPIIASLTAPTSLDAQSVNCNCTTPADCITKTACPSTVNCESMSMLCFP
ncbi:MAG: PqqD family peptide modification chaperone [Pyrinomonadaceae bacterium]